MKTIVTFDEKLATILIKNINRNSRKRAGYDSPPVWSDFAHEDREGRSPRRMANFMARHRGGDRHYADVECVNAELERYLVLSCT
jgi:hypothetical protein